MSSVEELAMLWPKQFLAELYAKRAKAIASVSVLTNQEGAYADAHRNLIRLIDKAIGAVEEAKS